MNAKEEAAVGVDNELPVTAVRVPSEPIVKSEMFLLPGLITYIVVPEASIKLEDGLVPAVYGDLFSALSFPVLASTENPEMLAEPKLVTYKKLPVESRVIEFGVVPTTAKGDPRSSLSAPVVLLMAKMEIFDVT